MVGKKMPEGCHQVASEAPLRRIGPLQKITFDQGGEESLGEILGIGGRVAASANIAVDRKPVGRTEALQSVRTLI